MTSLRTQAVSDARTVLHDLWRGGKGWILLTVSAGWFLSIGGRYLYPSVLPFLRQTFGFDLTTAGLLLSALWFAYALGQFPGGLLGDRIGEGNILVISTAICAAAMLLVSVSVTVWMLFLATAAFGFGTALYGPHRFTIFTDIYTDRAGTAVGLTMAFGSIGNTVLPAVAAAIAGYATWRLGFGFVVPLFVVMAVGIWIVVPSRTSTAASEDGDGDDGDAAGASLSAASIRRLLSTVRRGGIPTVVVVHIALAFVSQGFLGFYPTYLIEAKGFSPQLAAVVFGLYFAAGTVVQPLTGMSKDRFGAKWTLALLAGVFFVGLVALQFGQTLPHFLLLTVLLSHRNGVGVVTNTYIADTLPADIKGSGLGLLRTSWLLIGATSPILVGYLGDLGRLTDAFVVLAGVAGVATLLTLLIPSRSEEAV